MFSTIDSCSESVGNKFASIIALVQEFEVAPGSILDFV
jgi:hypothetical protein